MNAQVVACLNEMPVGAAIVEALRALLNEDKHLLVVDANERSITHRLAVHLQSHFYGYDIDCEYNRDRVDPKRIRYVPLDPSSDDVDAQTVFPDIIVHRRGTQDNLLVIEVKKDNSQVSRDIDLAKLAGYRQSLGFTHALFLVLKTGPTPDVSLAEWITDI